MSTRLRFLAPAFAFRPVLTFLLLSSPLCQMLGQPAHSSRVPLPFDAVDTLDGAKFKIRVPANWNGKLLVYLQGTKLGLPPPEPGVVPPVLAGSEPRLEETLLSRGYALAASEVGTTDMQVKESVQDHFALVSYFRGRAGSPTRVILWGSSAGGLSTLRLMEEFPRAFDAGIALCTPAAGNTRNQDRRLDFALAYATVFGWPAEWGSLEDTRPQLNFAADVNPRAQWPKPDGSNRGGWEFIRLVSGLDKDAFWNTDPMQGVTGFVMNMLFATQIREGLESWAAGPMAQNLDRQYALAPDEIAYLAGLGVNANQLLDAMNSRARIAAAPWARDYISRFGDVRGTLRKPVITVHTIGDGLAEVAHESAYLAAATWWGRDPLLTQVYVNGIGHCAFTSNQLLTVLAAMEQWLDTGIRPEPAAFPAVDGFDQTFVPPPWTR